jgi:serine/threonine-protein kinase
MNTQFDRKALPGIIIAAIAGAAISLYQWSELYQMRTSGEMPGCAVGETVNCATVWNASLSTSLHSATGIPFPGWGLIWSVAVIVLSLQLLSGRGFQTPGNALFGLRLIAAGASVIALLLLGYSLSLGVFCPTCVAFYLCVFTAAFFTLRKLPKQPADWFLGGMQLIGLLALSTLIMVYPGLKTPAKPLAETSISAVAPAPSAPATPDSGAPPADQTSPVAQFVQSLQPELQQALSDTLNYYKNAPRLDKPVDTGRITRGPNSSPLHFVEWIDIRCPHCKNLHAALTEISGITAPAAWNLETRHYPLDSQCNPNIPRSDGSGTNCLAAKLMICIADQPQINPVLSAMFEAQKQLTTDLIWQIASDHDLERAQLESCIQSDTTSKTLVADIAYAEEHGIRGTPLLVLNGREAPALPALIYAMILAGGDTNHAAFKSLPAPRPLP